MLNHIIDFSLRNRLLVCLVTALLVAVGVHSISRLPVDAFPDTTPVQVQINAAAQALSPEEVEAQITLPVELAIGGLPGLSNIRSISKFGFSQVVATFKDRTSIYRARQLVTERLQTVSLPDGIERPELGPIATGLGEVFHYLVHSANTNRTLAELRELQDWVIKPELRKVPGVAEVNSWGGYEKQYHVVVDTDLLVKHAVTLQDLAEALRNNNQNVGGGQVVRSGESVLLHGIGLTTNAAEIASIVVTAQGGNPVRVGDVATVREDHEIRRGAVTADGRGEAVLGLGFMLMGENSATVTHALKEKLAQVRNSLPKDVEVTVLYDRTDLVDKVIRTVEHNLIAGALLVVAVLFAFLGNLRAGLIVAAAIPLSMLFAGSLMLQAGIAASLLSLGAIDFGLIVDSSVIMVENCARHAATEGRRKDWLTLIRDAAIEVRKPTLYGELIILAVFLPVLTLEGIEGKFFRPMALTMIFALLGSLIISLTLMPVLASLFLSPEAGSARRGRRTGLSTRMADATTEPAPSNSAALNSSLADSPTHNSLPSLPWLVRLSQRAYSPLLDLALRFRKTTLAIATLLVLIALFLASRMGGEFLPRLGEGAIVGTTVRLAGIDVDESVAQNHLIEKHLLKNFPDEIQHIWTRLGTAEVATDPMGVELADFFLALKPRDQWKKARTQPELTEKLRAALAQVPGMRPAFSQPIEMRMNELVAGIRGALGIKVYGDDLEQLRRLGEEIRAVLAGLNGAAEVAVEQLTGQATLQVRVDQAALSRHGVPGRNVLSLVEAVGGIRVGEIREGQRRFPLVMRLPDAQRTDPAALAATLIPTEAGPVLPLSALTTFSETQGPATINREWGRRRVTVQCNVVGRDVRSFVEEARSAIASRVRLPEGYTIEWGGQFENMERANRRLMFVVPLALGLILSLLFFSLRSLRDVLIVATGIPLGLVGGVAALWVRDMPFTVSAGIGFVALSGVAMLNGLVLITFIRQRTWSGVPLLEAIREGCLARLRPVLMTALVAAAGFIPMAINVGVGGEIQRPLATVVIGGVISNTLLTLLVLPCLLNRRISKQAVEPVKAGLRNPAGRVEIGGNR